MFKPNPKAQAENKFYELFGSRQDVEINGSRLSEGDCKAMGFPSGTYAVQMNVAGRSFLNARSTDWRKAYKNLKIAIESAYADGKSV